MRRWWGAEPGSRGAANAPTVDKLHPVELVVEPEHQVAAQCVRKLGEDLLANLRTDRKLPVMYSISYGYVFPHTHHHRKAWSGRTFCAYAKLCCFRWL